MKKLLIILLLFVSCSDEEQSGGCLTAIPKNGTERMFIKCLTREEFNRGEHETASWRAYKGHKFEQCGNCK